MTMRDDANMAHYQVFKETRKTKCLPCYLTPCKWKRESVKTKGKVWILACNNHIVSTSKTMHIKQSYLFSLLHCNETYNIHNRSLEDCTMHRRFMTICHENWFQIKKNMASTNIRKEDLVASSVRVQE
jgi:hypothetical protein